MVMKTLDEQIFDIEKLDELRHQARKLQQESIDVLSAEPYVPRPRAGPWSPPIRANWDPPGDDVEKAQVLRALGLGKAANGNTQQENRTTLIQHLDSIDFRSLRSVAGSSTDSTIDSIPVLRAAYVLQAFCEVPGQALSRSALACFGRIVQELTEIVHPTWVAGAARGDEESLATAFVTGECARALLALETSLAQSATAAELLGIAVARDHAISGLGIWSDHEKKLQTYSLEVSLAALPHLIVEMLDDKGELRKPPGALLDHMAAELGKVPSAVTVLGPAKLSGPFAVQVNMLSEAFSKAAAVVTRKTLVGLHAALTDPDLPSGPEERGKAIGAKLRKGARIVRELLRPIEQFAESAIDRQIASASPHLAVPVDGAELVFAATLLGLVTDWKRPKVRAAYEVLYPLLSANGRLLSIRPFDLDSKGYRLHVATLEVTRRLADLVANLDVEPEPDFVARLMLPFEYTRMPGDPAPAPVTAGWTTDPPKREPKSQWWLTAIAAFALNSTVRMLDKTINRRILRDFHVRQPDTISLKLDRLFYPDYGVARSYKRDSIALVLQKLRAHAAEGTVERNPLFSLILYGPPGTGKTTLVEALAHSAGVPLVEVTPSDILVGGEEGMERRARQVFRALSKLTHVVILFDEFDSILLDREAQGGKTPTSVIEFLTPGMLPKLKALHDASEIGRVSYVLATNYLHHIDKAASREGRFDVKCGLYPPDVISRLGRLRDQLGPFLKSGEIEFEEEKTELQNQIAAAAPADKPALEAKLKALRESARAPENVRKRLLQAVRLTRGGPMSNLGKPANFTAPSDAKDAVRKLFGHILHGSGWEPAASEAPYKAEKQKYETRKAALASAKPSAPSAGTGTPSPAVTPAPDNAEQKYWNEWKTIDDADAEYEALITAGVTWDKAIEGIEALLKPGPSGSTP